MSGGIYSITCTVTNHRYIGQAKNFKKRWSLHTFHLIRGTHDNIHLQRAWKKYGGEVFQFEVLEQIDNPNRDILCEAENYWMQHCRDNGIRSYNLAPAAGSNLGYKHTEEMRCKVSQARKGKPVKGHKLTEEQRQRLSEFRRGKSLSPETKEKIRQKMLGRYVSPETRRKHSQSNRNRVMTAEARRKNGEAHAKEHWLIAPNGRLTLIFNLAAFCRNNNLSKNNMQEVLRGDRFQCQGWRKPLTSAVQLTMFDDVAAQLDALTEKDVEKC